MGEKTDLQKMTMKQLESLRAELMAELNQRQTAEALASNNRFVGKCFKYRNCFSCPETEADYWWAYRIVTKLSEYGHCEGWAFQRDRDGRITVEPDGYINLSEGWTEIPTEECRSAFRAIMSEICGYEDAIP